MNKWYSKRLHVLILLTLFTVLVLGCGYVSWALSQHPVGV